MLNPLGAAPMVSQVRWVAAVATLAVALLFGTVSATESNFTTSKGGFLSFDDVKGKPYEVDFDGRSFAVGGQRTLWVSGSVHPARVPPGEWLSTLQLMKSNGLNMVQIYVFWNMYEPTASGMGDPTNTDWGAVDLKKFVALAGDVGLFVNLRVGPYVCAEWKFGGLPLWLMNNTKYPTLRLRTNEPTWMALTGDWFQRVTYEVAEFLAPLGGPIVLTQVENELAWDAPVEYVEWAGTMARAALVNAVHKATSGLSAGTSDDTDEIVAKNSLAFTNAEDARIIPVLMCEGSVSKNTVPACNGPTCAEYLTDQHSRADMNIESDDDGSGYEKKVLVDYPGVWTENEGGYQTWGGSAEKPTAYFWGRGADDLAWASMRWFARGGSHMNYYMFAGGNNFGTTEGDAMQTAYATDVNVCPDGLPNEPKFSHLGNMHAALKKVAPALLGVQAQVGKAVFLPHRGVLVADDDGDGVWDGATHVPLTYGALTGNGELGVGGGKKERSDKKSLIRQRATSARSSTRVRSSTLSKSLSKKDEKGRRKHGALLHNTLLVDSLGMNSGVVSDVFVSEASDAFTEVSSRPDFVQSTKQEGFGEVSGNVVAFEYDSEFDDSFVAFLENNSPRAVVADFRGGAFQLNSYSSVLVVGDMGDLRSGNGGMEVVYNTSQVPVVKQLRKVKKDVAKLFDLRVWNEPIALDPGMLSRTKSVTSQYPLPQIALTGDTSEYLWYHASFQAPSNFDESDGDVLPPVLWLKIIGRAANVYSVFIDGFPVESVADETHSPSSQNQEIEHWVSLGRHAKSHVRTLAILSESLGVSNYPIFPNTAPSDFEKGVVYAEVKREGTSTRFPNPSDCFDGCPPVSTVYYIRHKRAVSPPTLVTVCPYIAIHILLAHTILTLFWQNSKDNDEILPFLTIKNADTVGDTWRMRVGLYGEQMRLFDPNQTKTSSVRWSSVEPKARVDGVTWVSAKFSMPSDWDRRKETVLLDASSMGRGHVWVNGHDLGRYWNLLRKDESLTQTQRFYVVPNEWLRLHAGDANEVVFAEIAGAFVDATIATSSMERVAPEEAESAAFAVTGAGQKACEF